MYIRRTLYLLALALAFLGQILDVGYLFHYLFALVLTLPLLGLAVSLPAMLTCRAAVAAPGSAVRGEKAAWSLVVYGPVPLPLSLVKGWGFQYNHMTEDVSIHKIALKGIVPARPGSAAGASPRETWAADTAHCGLLEFRVERLWVCDCLGLFSLPVRRVHRATLPVYPAAEDPGRLDLPEDAGRARPAPRGKAAAGEDYELRPYREGDSLRLIHWKQSAKRDELVTREPLEDRRPLVVLTLDHFGAPEVMDRTLDRLAGYAEALLARERPFEVRWVHPETGAVRRFAAEDRQTYLDGLAKVLRDPAPAGGRSILAKPLTADRDTALYHIHITGEEVRRG